MLGSGYRTGDELERCWTDLQTEARECDAYLGERVKQHRAIPVERVGEGREFGTTRQLVMQLREKLRARVLSKAVTLHRDQTAR